MLASVPLSFLCVVFYLAVFSVEFGLWLMAWTPTNEDFSVELIE